MYHPHFPQCYLHRCGDDWVILHDHLSTLHLMRSNKKTKTKTTTKTVTKTHRRGDDRMILNDHLSALHLMRSKLLELLFAICYNLGTPHLIKIFIMFKPEYNDDDDNNDDNDDDDQFEPDFSLPVAETLVFPSPVHYHLSST